MDPKISILFYGRKAKTTRDINSYLDTLKGLCPSPGAAAGRKSCKRQDFQGKVNRGGGLIYLFYF